MITKRKDGRFCKSVTINKKRIYFYSSESTAKKAEKDIERQLIEFERKEEKGKTFKEVADEWDSEYRNKISDINYNKSVKASYERIIKYFSQFDSINDITVIQINTFINTLISQGYYKKTIATHKSTLNMIFQYAVLNGYIEHNPVSDIRLPNNLPKKARELPSNEEIRIVSEHYEGFDLLPYFILYTGLRRSEALAIQYEDIDYENKLITVNKHLLHRGNTPVLEKRTKTENSKRTVILLDRLADKLPKGKKGFLFCNNDGSPLTKQQYARRWESWQKRYNISITAHQLRHAYATMLFEAGIDLKDAQELMGHSDINLTRQIYTHIRDKRKAETADKLNAFNF